MVTEEGIIEKASQDKAVIRIQRSSACTHCKSRGACQFSEGKAMLIEVPNDLQAKINDHVEISVPEGALLKLSLLVYFVPILALIAGALGGSVLAQSFNLKPTLTPILCGGFFMGIAFCVLKWVDRGAQVRRNYQPRMTKILFSATSPQPDGSR
jgi:sigma-E factor negative regulatory protein RseC